MRALSPMLLILLPPIAHSTEVAVGSGIGDPYGRAGVHFSIGNPSFSVSIARHLAWPDYTLTLTRKIRNLSARHALQISLTGSHNFIEDINEMYQQRICLGLHITHDIGNPAGFQVDYGFQVLRYFWKADELTTVIPILGLRYGIEI